MKSKKKNASTIFRSPATGKTRYVRLGTIVERPATSNERRSNTRQQFEQRQRMRHSIALWKELKTCNPMFTEHKIAYNGFISLANRLPVVFVPCKGMLMYATLLVPGIPMSEGTIMEAKQQFGTVDGAAALVTNLRHKDLHPREDFLLYTAEQHVNNGYPWVTFKVRNVKRSEFIETEGFLALVDNDFSDEKKGWALVRVNGKRCSSQGIITRCNYYEQFTTEEAMQVAVKSYGGLKKV